MKNNILTFGKFKGQELSNTPTWYQDWLLQQDWFNSAKVENPKLVIEQDYALLENGVIHTDDLTLEDAKEMEQRHRRCFPNCVWEIRPMSAVKGMDKAEGILERHMRISAKYA
jgi:uncharacterized protein (DUF3820 family)